MVARLNSPAILKKVNLLNTHHNSFSIVSCLSGCGLTEAGYTLFNCL